MWETLLYLQPGCQTTYGMKLLEQLVEARLDGQLGHHQKVEQMCSSKRLLQAPGEDETWIMFRAKNTEGEGAGGVACLRLLSAGQGRAALQLCTHQLVLEACCKALDYRI